jgi:hypothetical protein
VDGTVITQDPAKPGLANASGTIFPTPTLTIDHPGITLTYDARRAREAGTRSSTPGAPRGSMRRRPPSSSSRPAADTRMVPLWVTKKAIAANYLVHHDMRQPSNDQRTHLVHASCAQTRKPALVATSTVT